MKCTRLQYCSHFSGFAAVLYFLGVFQSFFASKNDSFEGWWPLSQLPQSSWNDISRTLGPTTRNTVLPGTVPGTVLFMYQHAVWYHTRCSTVCTGWIPAFTNSCSIYSEQRLIDSCRENHGQLAVVAFPLQDCVHRSIFSSFLSLFHFYCSFYLSFVLFSFPIFAIINNSSQPRNKL